MRDCTKLKSLYYALFCVGMATIPLGMVAFAQTGCANKQGSTHTQSSTYAPPRMRPLEAGKQTKEAPKKEAPKKEAPHRRREFAYIASGSDIFQFRVSQQGHLSSLLPELASTGQEIRQIVPDPHGQSLYVTDNNSQHLSQYTIKPDGTLSLPAASVGLLDGEETDMVFSPDGKFLYVATDSGTIEQFDVQGGKSIQLHLSLSLLNRGADTTLAVEPRGRFLYYGHNGSLSQMRIRRDGVLEPLSPADADGGTFYSIVPSADGKFVYAHAIIPSTGMGAIREYKINVNGTLRLLTHDYVPLNTSVLVSHPRRPYLYAANLYGLTAIQPLRVLPSGRLHPFSSVSYAGGVRFPSFLHTSVDFSIDPTGRFAWSAQNDFTQSPAPPTQLLQYRVNSNGTLTTLSTYSFKGKVFSPPIAVWH